MFDQIKQFQVKILFNSPVGLSFKTFMLLCFFCGTQKVNFEASLTEIFFGSLLQPIIITSWFKLKYDRTKQHFFIQNMNLALWLLKV